MDRLKGKVAIVTGAASGIGLATAELFVREGATVVMTDRDEVGGRVAERVLSKLGKVLFVKHDVSVEADWEAVLALTIKRYENVDILVNNAGIQLTRGLEETSLEDWRRVFSINVESTFIGTRLAVQAMKVRGGSIVNVASTYSLIADGLNTAYCASKGAVRQFTKAAALYCADRKYPIRINAVHPGVIMTPMVEREIADLTALRGLAESSSVQSEVTSACPLGVGQPGDIADGILYLASSDSKFATGSDLVIDGGHTSR